MAPTLVNVAFGALLAAALLGAAFDRRSVAVVVAAAALPDLDAVASLVVPGATNALLHAVWLPLAAGVVLYWDTERRGVSRLRERAGWRGVRIAWVALAAFLVAGVGPDLFGGEGVNLLYPLHDAYYLVDGALLYSTQDGVVQTFVTVGAQGPGILPFEVLGTTESYAISTFANPDGRPGLGLGADREFHLVRTGWQLVVVAAAVAMLTARFRRGRKRRVRADASAGDSEAGGDGSIGDDAEGVR